MNIPLKEKKRIITSLIYKRKILSLKNICRITKIGYAVASTVLRFHIPGLKIYKLPAGNGIRRTNFYYFNDLDEDKKEISFRYLSSQKDKEENYILSEVSSEIN